MNTAIINPEDFVSNDHAHSFLTAMKTINCLAQNQGLYSDIKASMEEQGWKPLVEICRDNYFIDEVDFVVWVEG